MSAPVSPRHAEVWRGLEQLEARLLLSSTIIDWGGDHVASKLALNRTNVRITGDYDGQADVVDELTAFEFSDTITFSPTSGYSGQPFYGGATAISYDDPDGHNSFSSYHSAVHDNGTNDTVGILYEPGSAYTHDYASVFIWNKADFAAGYDAQPVTLDADSVIRIGISRMEGGSGRLVVRDGGQYYVSQTTFHTGTTFLADQTLVNEMWAVYNPTAQNVNFDQASATYATNTLDFTDITAMGLLHDVDQRNGRTWTTVSEFNVKLNASPYLADMAPSSITTPAGDVDPNTGVSNTRQWFDASGFQAADGTVYAEGVGYYYGDGFQPGLSVQYDIGNVDPTTRVLRFDLFADANIGNLAGMDDALMRVQFVGDGGSLLYEANVTLGDGDAPILDDVYLDLSGEDTLTIRFDTEQYVPVNGHHAGVVLGDAEFVTSMPAGPGNVVTQLAASAVPGDGSRVQLAWRGTAGVEEIDVERSADGGQTWSVLATVGGGAGQRLWVDTTAAEGVLQHYRLRPKDASLTGTLYSPIVSATPTSAVDFAAMSPLIRLADDAPGQRANWTRGQWRNLGAFEDTNGAILGDGLGMLFTTGYGHPMSALTFTVPPDGANKVLKLDLALDANLGDWNGASDKTIRVQIYSDYIRGNWDKAWDPGTEASSIRTTNLYEGVLTLGAGQAVVLDDIYLDLQGHQTFTITVEEDVYDPTTHATAAVLITDAQFVAAMPGDVANPRTLRASAVAGHDDQLVVVWDDRADNETGYEIERSADGQTWSALTSVGADVNTYVDSGLNAGETWYYRVRAVSASGVSAYSNIGWATTTASTSLAALTPLQYEFNDDGGIFAYQRAYHRVTETQESPNPRVGIYSGQWWDGSAMQAQDGTIYTDAVGFARSNNPYATVRMTYHVPADANLFRFDLFQQYLETTADARTTVYGDYGLAGQTLLWQGQQSFDGGVRPIVEDVYLELAGYKTLTFEFTRATGLGYTTKTMGEVLGDAMFVDSYPPGPIPPGSLSAAPAPVQRIELNWDDRSDNEDGFELQRGAIDPDTGQLDWTQVAVLDPDTTHYSDTNLPAGVTFYYRIRTFNVDGTSPWSSYANATTNQTNTDVDILSSTYIGGAGDDAAGGVDIQSDGDIIVGGLFASGFVPGGVTPIDLLGGGDGAIIRYDSTGTQVLSVARLPGAVIDLRVGGDDRIAVAIDGYGPLILTPDADAVHADTPTIAAGDELISRIDIGTNNHIATLLTNGGGSHDHEFRIYDDLGVQRGARPMGDHTVNDIAYSAVHDLAYLTGTNVRQIGGGSTLPITVAFVDAFDPANVSTPVWTNYDWPTGTAATNGPQPGTVADSHGERLTIGRDGMLYFAAESAGTASMFIYDPQVIDLALTSDQHVITDIYTAGYNAGSAHITWVGRYDAGTGAIDKGQWLEARLNDGKTNTHLPVGLDADVDGNIYLTGRTFFSLENREGRLVEGQPLAAYLGGEAYVAKLNADLASRAYWTPFTAGTNSTNSSGVGIAARNGLAVAAANVTTDLGEMVITENAEQPTRGAGDEAYLVTIGGWGNGIGDSRSLTAVQTDDARVELDWVDFASLKDEFRIERNVNGGGWVEIATSEQYDSAFADTAPGSAGSVVEYRVRAARDNGDGTWTFGDYSNTAQVTIAVVPPTVVDVVRNGGAERYDLLDSLTFTFSEGVTAAPQALSLFNDTTGQAVSLAGVGFVHTTGSTTATWNLSSLGLGAGRYTVTLNAFNIFDNELNPLDGDGNGSVGGNHVQQLLVAHPGDTDLDGDIDNDDIFLILGANKFAAGPSDAAWAQGDFDDDGDVDNDDIFLILGTNQFGQGAYAATAAVDEDSPVDAIAAVEVSADEQVADEPSLTPTSADAASRPSRSGAGVSSGVQIAAAYYARRAADRPAADHPAKGAAIVLDGVRSVYDMEDGSVDLVAPVR